MNEARWKYLLDQVASVNAAVYGDFCLDAYWILSPNGSEHSVETGLKAEAVAQCSYTPGGAGNIVANMQALCPAHISCIGCIGADIWGNELKELLKKLTVDTSGLIEQSQNFDTYTYIKRYAGDQELARIDFGVDNIRSKQTETKLLTALRHALDTHDVLVINQQVVGSITVSFINELNRLIASSDTIVLLDSRHYSDHFLGVSCKINTYELAKMYGKKLVEVDDQGLAHFAQELYLRQQKPVFVTQGPKGIWVIDQSGRTIIPGIQVNSTLDTVGAGDTVVSALALYLAAGCTPKEAATLANIAAAVTIKKIRQTGTATHEEIWDLAKGLF